MKSQINFVCRLGFNPEALIPPQTRDHKRPIMNNTDRKRALYFSGEEQELMLRKFKETAAAAKCIL